MQNEQKACALNKRHEDMDGVEDVECLVQSSDLNLAENLWNELWRFRVQVGVESGGYYNCKWELDPDWDAQQVYKSLNVSFS